MIPSTTGSPGSPPAPIGDGRGSSARPSLPLGPDRRLISPLQMRPDRPSQGDNPPIATDNENQEPPTHGPGDAPMDNIGNDEFPSHLLCPFLVNEPPVNAVTFDIPDSQGRTSQQAFEHSEIYRFIATPGVGNARAHVRHPTASSTILRREALSFVRAVSPETQALITLERERRGLSLDESSPLTQNDHDKYNRTINANRR